MQIKAAFLLYDPIRGDRISKDVASVAYNWIEPSAIDGRDKQSVEVFYRFPVVTKVDMTLSYQSVIKPALAPTIDHA